MGNGFHPQGRLTATAARPGWAPAPLETEPQRLRVPLLLFLVTVVSTLAVGSDLSQAFARTQTAYPDDYSVLAIFGRVLHNPGLLLSGWPFAATLMGILLAHELGHYFACRRYGISATYPYFLPAPTLIGTFGAFIRIRSPIVNRRALFDVGIAGPLVGFVLAVPTLAIGLALSKVAPVAASESAIVFGSPPLVWLFEKIFHPGVPADHLLMHPIAVAAWVGLFATALNLLPVGQLDGGHIVYALTARRHRTVSRLFLYGLLGTGLLGFRFPNTLWPGWLFWGGLLLLLGMRHPAVLDPGPPLDRGRRWVAFAGLVVFLLCFTPLPFTFR